MTAVTHITHNRLVSGLTGSPAVAQRTFTVECFDTRPSVEATVTQDGRESVGSAALATLDRAMFLSE